MDFVSGAVERLALLEILDNVRVAGSRDEGWKPIQPGHDAVFDLARGDVAWPADDGRHAESAFHHGSFTSGKRCLTAIWPREVFRTVVSGEQDDGVLLQAVVLEVFHDRADDVVE